MTAARFDSTCLKDACLEATAKLRRPSSHDCGKTRLPQPDLSGGFSSSPCRSLADLLAKPSQCQKQATVLMVFENPCVSLCRLAPPFQGVAHTSAGPRCCRAPVRHGPQAFRGESARPTRLRPVSAFKLSFSERAKPQQGSGPAERGRLQVWYRCRVFWRFHPSVMGAIFRDDCGDLSLSRRLQFSSGGHVTTVVGIGSPYIR